MIGSHTGTHMDAPSHFIDTGPTIDEFPVDLSWGLAQVVDFRKSSQVKEITLERFLDGMEGRPLSERMLLVFGWVKPVCFGAASARVEIPRTQAPPPFSFVQPAARLGGDAVRHALVAQSPRRTTNRIVLLRAGLVDVVK